MSKEKTKNSNLQKQGVTHGKTLLFKIIAMCIPALILLVMELSLRIFHYGNDLCLFVESPENKDYLAFNPEASKKYFTNKSLATVGNVEFFRKKKEKGTLRIFVLGESTTAGYPYFHNGSFHRWLQYRLWLTFPDKKFEIVNLSLTAVNSYTILGFAKEVVKYNPDAVLIYTGHNEYYGTLGVASTDKIGSNPFLINTVIKLRELRLTQLLANLIGKISNSNNSSSGGTRMKMMVGEEQINYNSILYFSGLQQFKKNIDQTLQLFHKHSIPVFLGTLVSNEKDQKPFTSIKVDSIRFPEFVMNYNAGRIAYEKNNILLAEYLFKKANKSFHEHALCNYYLGEIACKQNKPDLAKEYYEKAKDLDGLRFRAPEQFNVIIKEECEKYLNVYLVDVKSAFENVTVDHIIGKELVLEHVHPNLTGYAVMSDAFYNGLIKSKIIPDSGENEMSLLTLMLKMPVLRLDSLAGAYKIERLKGSWPFSEAMKQDGSKVETEEEQLAWQMSIKKLPWQDAMNKLYTMSIEKHDVITARKVMEALVLEYPQNSSLCEKAAVLSEKSGDMNLAFFYLKRSFGINPSNEKAKRLYLNYLRFDKPKEALPFLEYACSQLQSDEIRKISQNEFLSFQDKKHY